MLKSGLIKLQETYDADKLQSDFSKAVAYLQKQESDITQLYVTSPTGHGYLFDSGDLRKHGQTVKETDFCIVNGCFSGTYTEQVFHDLDSKYGVCRTRFMRMDITRRAYSYHKDTTPRLHIPLVTNEHCMFLIRDHVRRMPETGKLYAFDTRKIHTALNLSPLPRLHLVFVLKDSNAIFGEI